MPALDVTVSIVTGSSANYLCECIKSVLVTQGQLEIEIMVVDNCAPYDVANVLRDFPDVAIISNTTRLGLAANQNQILRRSQAPYVFVLNDDTVLFTGCMQNLIECLQENPRTGMAVPKIFNEMALETVQANVGVRYLTPGWALLQELVELTPLINHVGIRRFIFREFYPMTTEGLAPLLGGAGMLVRRTCITEIGLMDERYGLYYEEMDWCLCMRKAGWELRAVPEAKLVHFGGGTTRDRPDFYVAMQKDSRKRFLRKWYPMRSKLIFDFIMPIVGFFLRTVLRRRI